ncbi:MAG: hypothetical protein IJS19_03900 [Muribaculaceae bacterium]|nr:hypothetical protein [Muribaculaceae bacterium]
MKRLLMTFLTATLLLMASADNLSMVDRDGSWYKLYNESGRCVRTLSASIGELQGFGSTYFIVKSGSWYKLYSSDGKLYKTMSVSSVGQILTVGPSTLTSRSGSWIHTWSRDGKRVSTRAAGH